ncbi:dephospho-CoA kinase [Massilia sp. P8910]|uniref:dephospho-CoA kinase n=1 Tax=Massilia antarctica TaxID=2765360 RepID=UPI001E3E8E77|nr:dephospho-CoA kinase [Massilia antarctica]
MDSARAPDGGKFKVGLTGGIGCGKTAVSDRFAALGASIIDTDLIAHALTVPGGAAMDALLHEFGPAFVTADGALDRMRMRELVFSDPPAKARLEAILHPRIRAATAAAAAVATGAYLIYVVPLLIESGGWRERVARVLVIDCPEELQIARVMRRNAMSEAQVRAIMANQVSRAERLAAADDVLTNDGSLEALDHQIALLHAKYLAFSERMALFPVQRL